LHEQNSSGSLPDTSFIFSSWLARFLRTAKLSTNQPIKPSEICAVRPSLNEKRMLHNNKKFIYPTGNFSVQAEMLESKITNKNPQTAMSI
jgi:hypothetical protein